MKKLIKILFCSIIFVSALIPLFGYAIDFKTPNLEKSSLAPFPDFIENNQLNLAFTTQFDDYFSDQFPFRTYLISAYNRINEIFLNQSGNEKVIIGKGGFLFFEETLDDYFKVNTLSSNDLIRLNNSIGLQKKYLDSLSIASYFMVVPNKESIYGEYMPSHLKVIGETSNLEALRSMNLQMPFIDVKAALMVYKSETDKVLYHLKDTHWNNLGAAVGYEAMLKDLGRPSLSLLDQTPTLLIDWQGDLSTMLFPSHAVYDQQYNYELPGAFTFTRAIRSFEDVEIESLNPVKTGHLMMFRDSFANALVPFLSDSFGKVNYSRVFPYDYRKVEILDPDQLVIEIAERNINWLLQSTPILVMDPMNITTPTSGEIGLSCTFIQSLASGYNFLNVRYDDQAIGEKITAVKIVDSIGEYDAFPIYQDGDFEDDMIQYGFSIYTQNALDFSELEIRVQIDETWFRVVVK